MYPSSVSYDEIVSGRRKRIRNVTLGIIGIGVLSLTAWIYFKELEPGTPLLNNVMVFTLVNINIILLMLLVLLVARNLIRLVQSTRSGLGGARLQVKLILSFVGFTIVPSILLFFVASGLINKSLNKLFDMKVEGALKGSFEVAQTYYREMEHEARGNADLLSRLLTVNRWGDFKNPVIIKAFIGIKREELRSDAVFLYTAERKLVTAVSRKNLPEGVTFSIDSPFIAKVLGGETSSSVESSGQGDVVHGIAPVRVGKKVTGFVVVSHYIPERLVEKVKGVFNAYGDYKGLELSKNPIKASYIITFLLITLLILFAAVWFGFYLARGITVPIEKLAEGTRAVSEGDLNYQVDVQAEGEVGILVDAFNLMTHDLKLNKERIEAASEDLRRSSAEIDRRRRYMETMLKHIGTGVISFDRRGRVTILNNAAGALLNIDPQWSLGRPFSEVFQKEHLEPIRHFLRAMRVEGRDIMSEQVEVLIDGRMLILRGSLAFLRSSESRLLGAVVVFDDMTALIRAQKVAAWQEVAQGIAHEIKNPLTPIQLSAQRMQRKFEQEALDFPEVFEACTDTIIHQVQGLMEMVIEFSRFARMPEPRLRPCRIDELLGEVTSLYRDRRPGVRIVSEIPDDLPRVMADSEQIQRVFINLVENAFEAISESGNVALRAQVSAEGSQLVVEVADDGEGIPQQVRGNIFSPYFTTKSHGSGLGLAICHRIVSDHNGTILVHDNQPRGSVFRVTLPLADRADYSVPKERTAAIG